MEALGRLAGGIAHDFNNLLSVISGYAVLAQERIKDDESTSKMLRQVVEASAQAAELTKQLLSFSRRQPVELRTADLNQIILDTALMLRRLIGEDIVIRTSLADDVWKVCADSSQIGQVIMNLALNARDAMPDGGTIVIETQNWPIEDTGDASHSSFGFGPGDYVRLMISDD